MVILLVLMELDAVGNVDLGWLETAADFCAAVSAVCNEMVLFMLLKKCWMLVMLCQVV